MRECIDDHHRAAAQHHRVEDRGVHMQGQPRGQRLGNESAGKCHAADRAAQSRSPSDVYGALRARSVANLVNPMPMETDGVGCDDGGAFQPRRHQERQQDDAGAHGAAGERSPAEGRNAQAAGSIATVRAAASAGAAGRSPSAFRRSPTQRLCR